MLSPRRRFRPLVQTEESLTATASRPGVASASPFTTPHTDAPRAPDQPSRMGGRSPISEILPSFTPLHGWFSAIDVAAPTINAGESAWYGLAQIRPFEDMDQELQISGIEAELLPADVDGTGGSGSLAWGTAAGLGAALVLGIGLPITQGEWRSAPAIVPGIETSGSNLIGSGGDSRLLWYSTLPTGKLTDTVPNKWHVCKSWGAFTARVPQHKSVDIALVVRRSAVNGLTGTLYGLGSLIVTAGQVDTMGGFQK